MASSRAASLKAHFSDNNKKNKNNTNQALRPIITSLNGDNSWLYSFPRPVSERERSGKLFFHLVHDPWLNGPTSFVSPWVMGIALPTPANVTTGSGVEEVVQEIETAAAEAQGTSYHGATAVGSPIDAIIVNIDAVDHLHEPTLRTFDPSIPVFAPSEPSKKISGWKYFKTVVTHRDAIPGDGDWRALHPGSPLPDWLTVFRMNSPDWLNFATAIVISNPDTPGAHEAIVYTPHGVPVDTPSIRTFLHESSPKPNVLAILHGLKESSLVGWKNTFGVEYGLQLYREAKAKYWVATHNATLQYCGLLSYGVSDTMRTLEWGLENQKDCGEGRLERDGVNLVAVPNGGFFMLS